MIHAEPLIRTAVGITLASVVSLLSFLGTVAFTVFSVLLCSILVAFVAVCAIFDQSFRVAKMVYHEMRWGPKGE